MVRAMRLDVVTGRESVDGEERRLVLGWGHPRRREASSVLCFLPGSWAARVPRRLWKRQGHWHNSPRVWCSLCPHGDCWPNPRISFIHLSSFSMSKAEKQDGAGSCLYCVVRVSS